MQAAARSLQLSPLCEPEFTERPDGMALVSPPGGGDKRREEKKSKLNRINEPSHIVLFLLL